MIQGSYIPTMQNLWRKVIIIAISEQLACQALQTHLPHTRYCTTLYTQDLDDRSTTVKPYQFILPVCSQVPAECLCASFLLQYPCVTQLLYRTSVQSQDPLIELYQLVQKSVQCAHFPDATLCCFQSWLHKRSNMICSVQLHSEQRLNYTSTMT